MYEASVTIKAFICITTTRKPLRAPITPPTVRAISSDTGNTSHSGVNAIPSPTPCDANKMPVVIAARAAQDLPPALRFIGIETFLDQVPVGVYNVDPNNGSGTIDIYQNGTLVSSSVPYINISGSATVSGFNTDGVTILIQGVGFPFSGSAVITG